MNMFLKWLVLISCIFFRIPVNAQAIVGVPAFDFKEPITQNLANQVTEFVASLLKNSGKYTVVDLTSGEQRAAALERAQENYKAKNWLDSYSALNAEVILAGEITSIKFVKSSFPSEPGYRAAVTMTIKLVQVESSEIYASSGFASHVSSLRLTPETALSSALESLSEEIMAFFRKHIVSVFPIVKVNLLSKDKVERITCEIPIVLGYTSGKKLKIIWYEKSDERSVPQVIGEARILEHIAENYWLLEVIKGGKEFFYHKDELKSIQCSE